MSFCRLAVRMKLNARQSQVLGHSEERGVLEVALNAPARDGEANAELIELMSDFFHLPKRNFAIITGLQNREKLLEIEGDCDELEKLLKPFQCAREPEKIDSPVRYSKSNLPSKICAQCGQPFNWRKKWERCWDEVRFCSDRCRTEVKNL